MEKDITYPIDDVNDDYGFYFTYHYCPVKAGKSVFEIVET